MIEQGARSAPFYKQALAEYEKRLGRYCKISVHFLKKEKDWRSVLVPDEGTFLVLPGRDSFTSEAFSARIGDWEMAGKGTCRFLIPAKQNAGGKTPGDASRSFPEKTKEGDPPWQTLCLSAFSMDPALSALILEEQIYRGYRILRHHPYHK